MENQPIRLDDEPSGMCKRCAKHRIHVISRGLCVGCVATFYEKRKANLDLTVAEFIVQFPFGKRTYDASARTIRLTVPDAEQRKVAILPRSAEEFIPGLVVFSPQMQHVCDRIKRVASQQTTVAVYGETGVGKELIAKAIHLKSDRSGKPFVVVDCTTLTPDLFESELFGHARGAFTGAVQNREGLVALADGGTIFFDEISELPLALQPKLLRLLESMSYRPVGSDRSVSVDLRVVVASNRNLPAMVAAGSFRPDLFYRVNVFPIRVPSLRERLVDVPILAEHFLKRGEKPDLAFSEQALNVLAAHRWEGNVRELKNVVEYAAVVCEGATITVEHLDERLWGLRDDPAEELMTLKAVRNRAIRGHIRSVLDSCKGDKAKAASILGIETHGLYRYLRKYGIAKKMS